MRALVFTFLALLPSLGLSQQSAPPEAAPPKTASPKAAPAKPAAEAKPAETATGYAQQGMKALDAGEFEKAAALFQKAAEADPKDPGAQFYLAFTYSQLKKNELAVESYRKVLELQPGLYQANLNLGILLTAMEKPDEAVEPLRAAVEAKPAVFAPVFSLAEALAGSADFPEAQKSYEAALAIDPQSAAALYGLGRCQEQFGRYEAAAESYEKAAAIDAAYAPALLGLAETLERNQMPDRAVAIYRKFPDNPAATERVAAIMLAAGKAADAVQSLEKAVQAKPSAANRLDLALAYERSHQPEKALAVVDEGLQADPRNIDLLFRRGVLLHQQRKFAEAASAFAAVAKLKPTLPDAWSELAQMFQMLEDYPRALGSLAQLEKLGAFKPGHYFMRAMMLDKVQAFKDALPAYETFLEASKGTLPDQEFLARQRIRIIKRVLEKKR